MLVSQQNLLRIFVLLLSTMLASGPWTSSVHADKPLVTIHDFIRKNLDKSNIEVGCWIETKLNYRDQHYNCNTKKSALNEDGSCLAGSKTKFGPQLPASLFKRFNISISRLSLSYLKGKLNQIDITVIQPSDEATLKQRITAGKNKHGIVSGKEVGITIFGCQTNRQCVSIAVQLPWNTPADDDCKVE